MCGALNRIVREDLNIKVAFGQRLERNKKVSHAGI